MIFKGTYQVDKWDIMGKWVEKSLKIANSHGYLDRLAEIYPAKTLPRRSLNDEDRAKLKRLHQKRNWKELLQMLFRFTKEGHPFPIEHPYASILRQKPDLAKKNLGTFEKLGREMLSMPIGDLIRGCERPIDLNRAMGSAFFNWVRKYFPDRKIPILPESEFERHEGLCFLNARNAAILDYVKRKLGITLERGRDLLAKKGDKYVIGEARFLSTSGGSQTRDLRETIGFVRGLKGKVSAIGVVDGIVWFNRSYVNMLSKLADDEVVLTALLLEDFLEALG